MSLVGSLEDLGLGDILQIISLSGKSGVLALHADEGEGTILFLQGRIRSALVRGGPTNVGELLASRNLPPADAIGAEELDSALHEFLEGCVLRMFTWSTGEFSFEVGDPTTHEVGGLSLDPGINPQYLALEGTRRADELAAGLEGAKATVVAEPYAEVEFQPASEPQDAGEPLTDLEPLAEEEAPPRLEAQIVVQQEPASSPSEGSELLEAPEPDRIHHAPTAPEEIPPLPPLVLIDPDLAVVEWVRESLPAELKVAHLFQMTEHGIARIRQYLRRAEVPVVILSTAALADPVSGARTVAEVVERLLRQAPQMRILMLEEVGRPISAGLEAKTHGRIAKPTQTQLATPAMAPAREHLGQELVRELLRVCGRVAPLPRPDVEDLREMSLQLRDSAAAGEVLPRVIEFASRIFPRVALFMIREDEALGIAQQGLPRAGGPDDAGIQRLSLHVSDCSGLQKVIEHGAPVRLVGDAGGSLLIAGLGTQVPREAWLAPIDSADRVVAVVYGDMLPDEVPIPDTAALEVVLQHAGLALDRAALARALEEPG